MKRHTTRWVFDLQHPLSCSAQLYFPVFQVFPTQLEPSLSCSPYTGLSREVTSFHPGLLDRPSGHAPARTGQHGCVPKACLTGLRVLNLILGLKSSGQISCLPLPRCTAILAAGWQMLGGARNQEKKAERDSRVSQGVNASGEVVKKRRNSITGELFRDAGSSRPQAQGSGICILTGLPGNLKFEKVLFFEHWFSHSVYLGSPREF